MRALLATALLAGAAAAQSYDPLLVQRDPTEAIGLDQRLGERLPRDVALRERLYQRLPPAAARAALAQSFPSGSASSAIEADLAHVETGARASERETLDRLAGELAARALHGGGPVPRSPGGDHA